MNVANNSNSNDTEIKFELFWELIKAFPPTEPHPKTGMHYEIVTRNNAEMLKVRRKKYIFVDEYSTKHTVRERFYALVTGYYPNGTKATQDNIRSMSVFVSVFKQFNNYINSKTINSIHDVFKVSLLTNKIANIS